MLVGNFYGCGFYIVDGIQKDDPATWQYKHGIAEKCGKGTGYPWSDVYTPRLMTAIDQISGKGKWDRSIFDIGWWIITFPGQYFY